MDARELDNRFSSARQALAEGRRRNAQNSRRLDAIEFKNLTQDVGEPVWPIQARQKSVHAADFDFFEQQGLIWGPLAFIAKFGETVVQFVRERAQANKQMFLGLPWSDADAAGFRALSEASLREQHALEAASDTPFEAFRQQYLSPDQL